MDISMKTYSPYISIILDGDDFEAEQIYCVNKYAEDKDWNIRQLLHTIFSDFRKGKRVPTVVICNDEEELFIAESYFLEESLALIGTRETVKAFKHKIDTLPNDFWNAIFSKMKELESSSETPFLDEPWNGYIDELLTLCTIGKYLGWVSCFNFEPEDFSSINDFYCLCVLSTFMGRTPHWTDRHWDNQKILSLLKAMDRAYNFNSYRRFIRTIEEHHRMGYEKIRICPCTSPNGMAWRCTITTKENTSKKCGAMLAGKYDEDETVRSNGNFKWNMMEMGPYDNALKFVKVYPQIAAKGRGEDNEYASWFKTVVRECYHYNLPTTYEDYYNCLEDRKIRLLGPNSSKRTLPFPPPGDGEGLFY